MPNYNEIQEKTFKLIQHLQQTKKENLHAYLQQEIDTSKQQQQTTKLKPHENTRANRQAWGRSFTAQAFGHGLEIRHTTSASFYDILLRAIMLESFKRLHALLNEPEFIKFLERHPLDTPFIDTENTMLLISEFTQAFTSNIKKKLNENHTQGKQLSNKAMYILLLGVIAALPIYALLIFTPTIGAIVGIGFITAMCTAIYWDCAGKRLLTEHENTSKLFQPLSDFESKTNFLFHQDIYPLLEDDINTEALNTTSKALQDMGIFNVSYYNYGLNESSTPYLRNQFFNPNPEKYKTRPAKKTSTSSSYAYPHSMHTTPVVKPPPVKEALQAEERLRLTNA